MDRSRHYDPGMEEFRTLRSRLYQLKEKTKSLRTIMVASALPGEGKTFVSTNLAQALVRQHGRRVLLIDADVRKPHMHQSLGAAEAPGLVDYLSGSLNQESVVQRGPLDNLFFIPGGKAVSNPSELIANGRLKALLENMRNLFHWIIVDSSPVVPVSDATLVASACDGVLLVLQADTTPVTIAQKARQEFKNIPILGVVLNRSKESPAESSYYYSYGRNRTFEQNS
ncbi:MAG TPA: CpsD/CapB family tyrosine-protein kinase [Terriglobales bacterium]|nr:CpsD/CapB family tyrosine-protein kinase [Terriglobales bacterium]